MSNRFKITLEELSEIKDQVVINETETLTPVETNKDEVDVLAEQQLAREINKDEEKIQRQTELVEGLECLRTIASKLDKPSATDIALFRVAANFAVIGTDKTAQSFLPAMESNQPIALEGFAEKIKSINKDINVLKSKTFRKLKVGNEGFFDFLFGKKKVEEKKKDINDLLNLLAGDSTITLQTQFQNFDKYDNLLSDLEHDVFDCYDKNITRVTKFLNLFNQHKNKIGEFEKESKQLGVFNISVQMIKNEPHLKTKCHISPIFYQNGIEYLDNKDDLTPEQLKVLEYPTHLQDIDVVYPVDFKTSEKVEIELNDSQKHKLHERLTGIKVKLDVLKLKATKLEELFYTTNSSFFDVLKQMNLPKEILDDDYVGFGGSMHQGLGYLYEISQGFETDLCKEIKVGLKVAQESIFTKALNVVERLFTSDDKILSSLSEFQNKNATEQITLTNPRWGLVFSNIDKKEINGKDIFNFATEICNERNNLIHIVEKSIAISKKTLDLMKKTSTDDKMYEKSIYEMGKQKDEVDKLYREVQKIKIKNDSKEVDILFKTANEEEIKKILTVLKTTLGNPAYKKQMNEIWNTTNDIHQEILNTDAWNEQDIHAEYADEVTLANIELIGSISHLLYYIKELESKIIYGGYKYLQASVK